jgi:hypothetical protein
MMDKMTDTTNKKTGGHPSVRLVALLALAMLLLGAGFEGYGVDTNTLWSVTANTTIAAKHCGGTIQAGTGATGFFTVTAPAVAGFPTNCVVNIINGDTTRGKQILGAPCSSQKILWPGQACKIGIVNGAWAVLSRPGRWHGASTTNWFTDFTNGTDTKGATDGLAGGTSAFKTAQECLVVIDDQIDFNGVNQTQAVCNMAAATTDTAGIHVPFHDLPGAQGGAALQIVGASLAITGAVSNGGLCEITVSSTSTYTANEIVSVYSVGGATGCNGVWKVTVTDGTHLTLQSTTFGGAYTSGGTVTNGSAFNVTGDVAFGCYFGTVIELFNVYFKSNANDLAATDGCTAEIDGGNVFGGGSETSLISVSEHGRVLAFNDFGIASGTSGGAITGTTLGLFNAEASVNINVLPGVNPAFAEFAIANVSSVLNFLNITINLNDNTVTGKRCEADTLGLVNSGTGTPNSYFPGNSNCTTSVGGHAN